MAGISNKGVVGSLLFELKFWVRYLVPTRYKAVFYPSPHPVVDRMLTLTDCGPSDTLFDLGCGDGRVLVAAARRGARSVGYELDAELVAEAQSMVKAERVEQLVKVIRDDAAKADVSTGTIIALYLSERGNRDLMAAVSPTLRAGTKVVSNFFPIHGWEQHLVRTCSDPNSGPIFLYSAPPSASGLPPAPAAAASPAVSPAAAAAAPSGTGRSAPSSGASGAPGATPGPGSGQPEQQQQQ